MADGVAVGREHGYTQGWNEATLHANSVIAERYQEIDRLSSEIHKGNAYIKNLRAAFGKSQRVSELYHAERDELEIEIRQLRQQVQALQEKYARELQRMKVFSGVPWSCHHRAPCNKGGCQAPSHRESRGL